MIGPRYSQLITEVVYAGLLSARRYGIRSMPNPVLIQLNFAALLVTIDQSLSHAVLAELQQRSEDLADMWSMFVQEVEAGNSRDMAGTDAAQLVADLLKRNS